MVLLDLRLLLLMIKVRAKTFPNFPSYYMINMELRFTVCFTLLFLSGYDVFLGNFRGLVSRDHVNKNISSKE